VTHYELFFFIAAGFKARDLMRYFGISEATSYRAHRNYRKAQKRARELIRDTKCLSFKREKEVNDLDH